MDPNSILKSYGGKRIKGSAKNACPKVSEANAKKAQALSAQGLTTAEIARELDVTTSTILTYLKRKPIRAALPRTDRQRTLGFLGLDKNGTAQDNLDRMQSDQDSY